VLLSSLRGGDYHIYPEHLRNLPIPLAPQPIQQPAIALVEKIIAAKASDPKADTAALERQVDNVVYRLYNLSYEEVRVIEPGLPVSRAEYERITVK
jgi:adenine-specific DNA-methyltransferase